MRKIVLSLVALVVIVCGLPYGMGYLSKRSIEQVVEQMTGNGYSLQIQSYQQGWLSSNAEIKIQLTQPALQNVYKQFVQHFAGTAQSDASFVWQQHVQHGPILYTRDPDTGVVHMKIARGSVDSKLVLNDETAKAITAIMGSVPVVHSHTLLSLAGNYRSMFSIDGINYTNASHNISVKWGGLSGIIHVAANFRKYDALVKLLGIDASSPQGKLGLSDVTMQNDISKNGQYDFWVGNGSVKMPSFNVSAAGSQVSIEGLNITSAQDINNDLTDGSLGLTLDKVVVENITYGPVNFAFNLKNLDAATWSQIQKVLQQNNRSNVSKDEQQIQALKLLPLFAALINKGAIFELQSCDITTPDGVVAMAGKVAIPIVEKGQPMFTTWKKAKANMSIKVPSIIVQKLLIQEELRHLQKEQNKIDANSEQILNQAKGSATPPVKKTPEEMQLMAQQAVTQKLTNLQTQGMITLDGKDYKVDASYDAGTIMINGKPMPVHLP